MSEQSRGSYGKDRHRGSRSPSDELETLGLKLPPVVQRVGYDQFTSANCRAVDSKKEARQIAPIAGGEVSPETIQEDSVPASPTVRNRNVTVRMSEEV